MILKRAEEGTAAWFEEARHKCVDHLRALNAVREAGRYARIILDLWGINNFEVLIHFSIRKPVDRYMKNF